MLLSHRHWGRSRRLRPTERNLRRLIGEFSVESQELTARLGLRGCLLLRRLRCLRRERLRLWHLGLRIDCGRDGFTMAHIGA